MRKRTRLFRPSIFVSALVRSRRRLDTQRLDSTTESLIVREATCLLWRMPCTCRSRVYGSDTEARRETALLPDFGDMK